jgi:hypothetical protein
LKIVDCKLDRVNKKMLLVAWAFSTYLAPWHT